jgi:tetraacyldisaccharide 4'-kinase
VLITRADRNENIDQLKESVGQHTNAPIFTARYVPRDIVDVATGGTQPLDFLAGKPVFAFAGIARPDSFFSLLRTMGAVVSGSAVFPDHYTYTKSDLAALIKQAGVHTSAFLATTEKDGVRLRNMAPEGIWAVRIDLVVAESSAWEETVLKAR